MTKVVFTKEEIEMLKITLQSYKEFYNTVKYISNKKSYNKKIISTEFKNGLCRFITERFGQGNTINFREKLIEILELEGKEYICATPDICMWFDTSTKVINKTFRVRIKALEKILKEYGQI